jgi:hypothetical protein
MPYQRILIGSRDGHSFATRRIAWLMVCISLRPSTLNGKSDSDISSVSVGDTGAKSDRTACKRASSVQSAQSNPTPSRTVSTDGGTTAGMPVGPYCDHRWGFPCCVWSPMRTCHPHYPGRFDGACPLVYLPSTLRPSLCNSQVGCSCNCFFGACSAFTHVRACTLAESPSDPLHRKLRQLRCLRCRYDCYRVERTSSRAGSYTR